MLKLKSILCAVAFACAAASQASLDLYVSPTGSDTNNGLVPNPGSGSDGPFATIEKARQYLKVLRRTTGVPHPVTIYMRGGVYRMPTGVEFEGEDSGIAGSSMTVRNYPGEVPYLRGSIEIDNWEPLSDITALATIPSSVHNKVLQANLFELGATNLGIPTNRGIPSLWQDGIAQLYDKQKPCSLASYPNLGQEMLKSEDQGSNFVTHSDLIPRMAQWGVVTEGFVHGYLGNNYADTMIRIGSYNLLNGRMDLTAASYYGYKPEARFRVENVLAELDAPGEYYIDRLLGRVYYYPLSRTGAVDCELSISSRTMVRVITASHLNFNGLVVEQGWRNGFEIISAPNTQISGCTIRNMGNMGAYIRSPGNNVRSTDVYNVGTTGLYIIGGTRSTLTPGNMVIDNCRVWNFGLTDYAYSPGIKVEGVGNAVTRSSISDGHHFGVFVEGNDHLIEGNDFANLATDTLDAGALAFNRDWTHRGNVVRRNRFRNIYDRHRSAINDRRSDTWAVYLDDCISGMLVEDNIFINVGAAFVIGGGRDNIFRNNIINNLKFKNPYITAPMTNSFHADSRLLTPNSYPGLWESLNARLVAMPYQNTLWASRYPALANILNDSPREAKNNVVERNLYLGKTTIDPETEGLVWYSMNLEANVSMFGINDNLYGLENLGLANPAGNNYSVVPFGKAAKIGFNNINTSLIGTYTDAFRTGRYVHPLP